MSRATHLLLYSGSDEYRVRLAVQAAADKLLDASVRDFNYDRASGRALDRSRLLNLLGTPPMMAQRRVVLVEDAEQLAAEARIALEEWAHAALERKEQEIVCIASFGAGKVPSKRLIEVAAMEKRYEAPDRASAVRWVSEYAKRRHGRSVSSTISDHLVERTGYLDSGLLAAEVDKLLTLVGERALTAEDVDEATKESSEESVFRFYDAIGGRDFRTATESAGRLLLNPKHDAIPLAAGVASHLLGLGLGCAMREAGHSKSEIESALGRGFYGRKLAAQSEKWERQSVDAALGYLHEADLALKSGGNPLKTVETFLARALLAPAAQT